MNNIEDIIREQYPFPIASSYQALLRYQRRLSSYKQAYTLLLDLHRTIVRYLALIVLSNYIRQKAFKGDFNNKLRQTLLKELTVGDWQHILRETLLAFRNQEEKLFIPALLSFYFRSDGNTLTDAGEILEILVESHPAQIADTLTDAQYEERYKRELPLMMAVLQQMQFLCSYQLLVPTLIGNGKILAAYDCTGLVNEFNEVTLNLPIKDESIGEYRAVLVDRRNNAHQILLYPLHVIEDDPIDDILDIMIFDGLKFAKDALISLRYLAINRKTHVTLSEHNVLHRSIISDFQANVSTILQLANLLVTKLKAQDTYYFTSQIDLIEAYASTFIGREDVLNSFRNFREQHVNGGIFLITGAPGEGKSALAAKIIKETGAIHHFIARDEGRNIEKYIVQSFMEQLMQRYDLSGNIPDDENELRRSFGTLLQSVKIICEHEHRQEIIVLDGLDELEFSYRDIRLDFLPSPLPAHIFVLLLSRPFEPLGLRVNGIDQTYELGPLTPKDVEQIVRTKVPDMPVDLIAQIFKYSQGNALYVHCLLKDPSRASLVGMQLPATIEELYRRILHRLHQTDGELAYRVLGILTTAHGKLSVNELSIILGQKKREILTRGFPSIRTFLVSSQCKYGIFHKSMRDFLTNPAEEFAFDRKEIQEFHQSIIDACQSDEPILEEYRMDNLPYHLYENNQLDEIVRIASLPEYTEAITNLLITHARASSSEKLEGSKLDTLLKQLGDSDTPIVYGIVLAFVRNIVYYGYLDYCYQLAQTLIERAKERQSNVKWLYLFAEARIVHAQGKLAEASTLLAEVELHLANLSPEQVAEFYFLKAETLRESGAYAEARTAYETCRDMLRLQKNEPLLLDTLLHLGDLEYVRGELSAAMQTLSDALSLSETLHLQLFVGQSHRLIGQIFYIEEKYREALNHYHKALDIFTLLDNQAYLGRIYMNLAETYVPIDLGKALSFAEAAIKLDTQFDFGLELGKALFTRADIARLQTRFADCARDVQASIGQFLRVGHISGLARAYRVQALMYLDQKEFENALKALDQSDESFAKIRVYPTFVLKNMITRLEIYSTMGEVQQAEETCSRLIEMQKTSELGYLVDEYFSSSPSSLSNGENA